MNNGPSTQFQTYPPFPGQILHPQSQLIQNHAIISAHQQILQVNGPIQDIENLLPKSHEQSLTINLIQLYLPLIMSRLMESS